MGVSQSIFKVIKSEIIRFPTLQSLRLFFVVAGDLDRGRGGKRGVRMRFVNCGGIYIDRGGVGMGKVFQLVILQALYSFGKG